MKLVTVFTPTYNRGYCLKNLYDSLKEQTSNNFLWLIVDDGSTDNTRSLIKTFQKERKVEIIYYYQKNSGKHVAHNKAVEMCETELFFCVDSDDTLTKNAVEIIIKSYNGVKNDHILGLYMRRIYKSGENVASAYPSGITRVGITELYHKYGFFGDTAIILKTALIKEYMFPVYEEERFVSESVFYNQLDSIAPMVLFEDPIYVCEYLPDGYSQNIDRLTISNPYGSATLYLSEAVYGEKMLYKIKNYSQYLALVDLFSLDKNRIYAGKKPCFFICIGGKLIKTHYIKLFRKMKKQYG